MLAIGDIHLYVNDLEAALRFWAGGLQLTVAEQDSDEFSAYARLEFPDGGPALVLIAELEPSPRRAQEWSAEPAVVFEVMTTDFDDTLARLRDHGGRQAGETETYNGLKIATLADPEGNAFELIELPADVDGN